MAKYKCKQCGRTVEEVNGRLSQTFEGGQPVVEVGNRMDCPACPTENYNPNNRAAWLTLVEKLDE